MPIAWAPDLRSRSTEPEWMDDADVSPAELRACLDDLATVNSLTLGRRPTLAWLAAATRGWPEGAPLRLIDVGYGHGDMLRAIHAWASRRGFAPDLGGIDLSPHSEAAARAATPAGLAIRYATGDVFAHRPERPVDFVVSSLFTHHLTDAQAARFVAWMERHARAGWFVNDLHRLSLPYHGFGLLARLARWHRFVRHDGPVSIARSFRPEDWRRIVRAAGLEVAEVTIARRFPFRLCVGRMK
jgi:SAM-dependent methyltransferase